MKAIRIKCIGSVQGVFFRMSTRDQALLLGLKGWVKNESDGSVSIYAIGEELVLEEFIKWCKTGSPMSRVEQVQVEAVTLQLNLSGFEIRR
jgi:acylphosphatase